MLSISINYSKACAEANRLKTIANECDNIISQSQHAVADIYTYWEGAAANEFLVANEKWCNEMRSIKLELLEISNSIIKVANEIREADLRAAESAKDM